MNFVSIDQTDGPALRMVAVTYKRLDLGMAVDQKRNVKGTLSPDSPKPTHHNVNGARVASTKNGDDGKRKVVCSYDVIHVYDLHFHAF